VARPRRGAEGGQIRDEGQAETETKPQAADADPPGHTKLKDRVASIVSRLTNQQSDAGVPQTPHRLGQKASLQGVQVAQ